MRIERLSFDGFRNLKTGTFTPSAGVNILYGDNAQGKTNVLEACWLFTGGKSFRGAKESELVCFDREKAVLSLDFEAADREQTASLHIAGRRQLTLNGVAQKSPSAMTGRFCAVVFCPTHLHLVSGSPEERRRFMDAAYCQLRPGYLSVLSEYSHILTQRNALLKAIRTKENYSETASDGDRLALLDVFDSHLALSAAKVTLARRAYLKRIFPLATEIYDGLSGGREQLSLSLASQIAVETGEIEELRAAYAAAVKAARHSDIAAGFSTVGAHREDLLISISGNPAKVFGSQGQQRSAVLALKLSEASLLREINDEQPIALLDDVMSELDISRQDYILNHIHGWQVLITCCDPVAIERQTGGKIFHIQNGNIL